MEIESEDTYMGVVAFLDILGTKGVWKDNPYAHLRKVTGLYNRFQGLVNSTKTELETKSKQYKLDTEEFSVEFDTFSDTIIVSFYSKWLQLSDYENRRRLQIHLLFSAILLIGLMYDSIDKRLYLRGSLSLGKIYKKEKIFIGPAIDEAACDYDQSNWIGISLTPHAAALVDSLSPTEYNILKDFFIPYDLSKKTGVEKGCYVLNWAQFYPQNDSPDVINNLKENVIFHLDKYKNSSEYMKYKNTIEYYTKVTRNGRFNMLDYFQSKLQET